MARSRSAFVFCFALAVLLVPSATAKDFGPGDVRLCGADRCVPLTSRPVLPVLRDFYFAGPPLRSVDRPQLGTRAFELRFRNGYATGVVATARLDRFLSFGVHLERFRRGVWYRVPAALSTELRELARTLAPLRMTRDVFGRAR